MLKFNEVSDRFGCDVKLAAPPATPEPNWKALTELAARVILQHMNDEDYEMSLAGLYAKLTEHVPVEGETAPQSQDTSLKKLDVEFLTPNSCEKGG